MSSATQTAQESRVHLLSKKSERLERDIFFFRPLPYGWLIGGLNQRLTPISPAILYRWAKLCDPACPDFQLYPIELKKCGILQYVPKPIGPAISSESTTSLPPGDYSLDVKLPDPVCGVYIKSPFIAFNPNEKSFAELKAIAELPGSYSEGLLPWYNFPTALEDFVTLRDGGRCVITGFHLDVGVSWIFPPAWAHYLENEEYADDPKALSVSSNAMLLRKDLMAAFHDNAFGVDVDADYRIVVFRDIGPARDVLMPFRNEPAFFRHSSAFGTLGPDEGFLRMHFRHCILVNFVGGDIGFDYPRHTILETMEALGVDGDNSEELASMNNPLWKTPLGKEIFEDYMTVAMVMAGAEVGDAGVIEGIVDSD